MTLSRKYQPARPIRPFGAAIFECRYLASVLLISPGARARRDISRIISGNKKRLRLEKRKEGNKKKQHGEKEGKTESARGVEGGEGARVHSAREFYATRTMRVLSRKARDISRPR